MFNFFRKKFFPRNVKREVSELYGSIAIKTFAVSMIAVFEPIFLYKIYGTVSAVILFYLLVYICYLFLLPLGGKIASRRGFEHSILYSIPVVILYFFLLCQIPNFPWLFWIAPLSLALYKALYWPAHHTDLAHYGNLNQRGAEVSIVYFLMNIIRIIGPVLGGIIIASFGFNVLFLIVSLLMLVSAFPLFTTRENFTPADFSYYKAIKRFLKPYKNYTRRVQLSFMGYGSDFICMICWPIFIFVVVKNYKVMGGLITLSLLITAIISLIIGKAIDKKEGDRVLKTSVIAYFFVWIFRYLFPTTAGVFTIDFLDRNIQQGINLPIRTFTYNEGKKRGFLKYVVFTEMALSLSKVLIALLVLVLLSFTSPACLWPVLFFAAGFFSLFYLFLPSS